MRHQLSPFLLLRGEACGWPRGLRSSSPEVCSSHLCAVEPEPSLRVAVHIRRAGRDPRGGAWGAEGLDNARATHFVQTGNRRRRGYAVSSRVTLAVAREPHLHVPLARAARQFRRRSHAPPALLAGSEAHRAGDAPTRGHRRVAAAASSAGTANRRRAPRGHLALY